MADALSAEERAAIDAAVAAGAVTRVPAGRSSYEIRWNPRTQALRTHRVDAEGRDLGEMGRAEWLGEARGRMSAARRAGHAKAKAAAKARRAAVHGSADVAAEGSGAVSATWAAVGALLRRAGPREEGRMTRDERIMVAAAVVIATGVRGGDLEHEARGMAAAAMDRIAERYRRGRDAGAPVPLRDLLSVDVARIFGPLDGYLSAFQAGDSPTTRAWRARLSGAVAAHFADEAYGLARERA